MTHFIKKLRRKLDSIAWTLASTGIMMILLGILVVFFNFFTRLVFGFIIILLAIIFIYLADKFWWLKRELDQLFRIK